MILALKENDNPTAYALLQKDETSTFFHERVFIENVTLRGDSIKGRLFYYGMPLSFELKGDEKFCLEVDIFDPRKQENRKVQAVLCLATSRELYGSCLPLTKADPDATYVLGEYLLYEANQDDEANEELLSKLLALHPMDFLGQLLKAQCLAYGRGWQEKDVLEAYRIALRLYEEKAILVEPVLLRFARLGLLRAARPNLKTYHPYTYYLDRLALEMDVPIKAHLQGEAKELLPTYVLMSLQDIKNAYDDSKCDYHIDESKDMFFSFAELLYQDAYKERKRFYSHVNVDYYCGMHEDNFYDAAGVKVFLFRLVEKDYRASLLLLAGHRFFCLDEDELGKAGNALERYALSHQEDYLPLLSLVLVRQYGIDGVQDPWMVLRLRCLILRIGPKGALTLL